MAQIEALLWGPFGFIQDPEIIFKYRGGGRALRLKLICLDPFGRHVALTRAVGSYIIIHEE